MAIEWTERQGGQNDRVDRTTGWTAVPECLVQIAGASVEGVGLTDETTALGVCWEPMAFGRDNFQDSSRTDF